MAGVIRQGELSAARAFSFADLEAQGRQILQRARERAAEALSSAEQRAGELAERQRQAGYEAGLAEGRAAGLQQIRAEAHQAALQEAHEQAATLLAALSAALTEFEHGKRGCLAAAELGLIELALAIARRVCKLDVGTSTAVAQANARSLLDLVRHAGDVRLCVNPAEYELLQAANPEFLVQTGQLEHVSVVASEDVPRGGCILRTPEGEIDATIEIQLQRIAEALRVGADGAEATGGANRATLTADA